MIDDIVKVIDQNLPAQVSDTIKKRIELVDNLEKQLDTFKKEYNKLKEINDHNVKTINNYVEKVEKYKNIEDREKALIAKETELKIMEVRLKEMELRLNDLKEITQTVFQSNRLNYNISGYVPQVIPPEGGSIYHRVDDKYMNLDITGEK